MDLLQIVYARFLRQAGNGLMIVKAELADELIGLSQLYHLRQRKLAEGICHLFSHAQTEHGGCLVLAYESLSQKQIRQINIVNVFQ